MRLVSSDSSAEHEQQRREDLSPARFGLIALIQHRVHPLVPWIGAQFDPVRDLTPQARAMNSSRSRAVRGLRRARTSSAVCRVVNRERAAALHSFSHSRSALGPVPHRAGKPNPSRLTTAHALVARPRTASRCCLPCCDQRGRPAHPATGDRAGRRDRRGNRGTSSRPGAIACGRTRAGRWRRVRSAAGVGKELKRFAGVAPAVHEHERLRVLPGQRYT